MQQKNKLYKNYSFSCGHFLQFIHVHFIMIIFECNVFLKCWLHIFLVFISHFMFSELWPSNVPFVFLSLFVYDLQHYFTFCINHCCPYNFLPSISFLSDLYFVSSFIFLIFFIDLLTIAVILCPLRWWYMLKCPKQPQKSPFVIFKN